MYINSGGDYADAKKQQSQYLADVLDAFEKEGMHWSDWIWRRPMAWPCDAAYAVICQESNGTYVANEMALDHLKKYLA